MYRKYLTQLLTLIALVIVPLSTNANASPEEAKIFIQNVSKEAIKVISSDSFSEEEKYQHLTELFVEAIDTKWISKFVLGQFWRGATEEQKAEYTALHKQFLINSYVPKFKQYNNQKIIFKRHTAFDENEYMVETEIIISEDQMVSVDYKIRQRKDGSYKIFDVVAEGVSLITTQRSEFSSILSRKGIRYLITKLKAKV